MGLWSSRPDSAQNFPAACLQFALEGLVENLWISLRLGPEDILLYFLFNICLGNSFHNCFIRFPFISLLLSIIYFLCHMSV